MQVVLVTQRRDSEVPMKLLIFIGCVVLLGEQKGVATVRATFYDAIFKPSIGEEFEDVNINSFQSSVGDLPNEVTANDDIQANKNCDACLNFYDMLKQNILMTYLLYFKCREMSPSNAIYCFILVDEIGSMRYTRDQTCKKLGFCNVHTNINVQSNNGGIDSDAKICDSCVKLLIAIKNVKAVQENVKRSCKKACSKKKCENFVGLLFKLINSLPAKKACIAVELCTKNKNWIDYGDTEQQLETGQAEENIDLEIALPQVTQTSPKCKFCEDLVAILQNPGYQAMAEKMLKDFSEKLPEPFKEMVKVVSSLEFKKFTAFINKKTAKKICVENFRCMKMSEEQSEKEAEDLNSNYTCQICVNMMTIFQNRENQDHVMNIIESFFEYIPEPFRDFTKRIILMYVHLFLEVVNQKPPKDFCINRQICKASKENPLFEADSYIVEVSEVDYIAE